MKLHIITFLLNYEFDIKTDLHGFYDKIRIVKTLDKRRNNFLFLLTHIFFIYYVRIGSNHLRYIPFDDTIFIFCSSSNQKIFGPDHQFFSETFATTCQLFADIGCLYKNLNLEFD